MGFAAGKGKVEIAYQGVKRLREAGVDIVW